MRRLTSRARSDRTAAPIARYVLPVPAGPIPNVTVFCPMASRVAPLPDGLGSDRAATMGDEVLPEHVRSSPGHALAHDADRLLDEATVEHLTPRDQFGELIDDARDLVDVGVRTGAVGDRDLVAARMDAGGEDALHDPEVLVAAAEQRGHQCRIDDSHGQDTAVTPDARRADGRRGRRSDAHRASVLLDGRPQSVPSVEGSPGGVLLRHGGSAPATRRCGDDGDGGRPCVLRAQHGRSEADRVPSGRDERVDLLRGPSTLRPDRDHDLPRQRVTQDVAQDVGQRVTQDVGQRCRTGHSDKSHRTDLCRTGRERPGRDRLIDRSESHTARLLERGRGDRAPALDDGLRSARIRPTLRALGDDGDEPIDTQLAGGAHGVLGATSLRERLGEHEPHPGRRRDDSVCAQPGTVTHELRVG